MHARCDADPLDFATDLCEQCGGEYCDDHLLYPYGPDRPPLCKACAIAVGGVRSTAAMARKRSRSQVKRRREELRALAQERGATGFEWFEEEVAGGPVATEVPREPPSAADAIDPGDEANAKRASWVPPWRRRRVEPATTSAAAEDPSGAPVPPGGAAVPGPTPARTSATVLLARLRESGAVPPSVERRPEPAGDRYDAEVPPLAAMFAEAHPAPAAGVAPDGDAGGGSTGRRDPRAEVFGLPHPPAPPLPPRDQARDRPPAPPLPPRDQARDRPPAPPLPPRDQARDRPPAPPLPPRDQARDRHPANGPAPATAAGSPHDDDRWSDVPPALRGPGAPPAG